MSDTHSDDGRRSYRAPPRDEEESTEQTPLIAHDNQEANGDIEQRSRRSSQSPASTSLLRSIQGSGQKRSRLKRWPSLIALLVLCVAIIVILIAAFVAPQVVSEYAKEAVVFEPTSLSIDSFTATGVMAHVAGRFRMDASRVKSKSVRDLGRFGTFIASQVETQPMTVAVSLPEYGNPVVGTAEVPNIKVNVRNMKQTPIDFMTHLEPGSIDAIRRVADDWLTGKLGQLMVQANAKVALKSGLITLPKQTVMQSFVFETSDVPDMPDFDILKLNIRDQKRHDDNGLIADAAVKVANDYPVDLTVPPLGFEMLVPGCSPSDDYIIMAEASTGNMHVEPKHDIIVNATALIKHFPKEAITACPGSSQSPLDAFLGGYLHGNESKVYVRGSQAPSHKTPQWVADLMSDITVPVPLPGRKFGHLMKEYKMEHVHFDLPDLFADPDTPESNPRISAEIMAIIALPDEINFGIGVERMRANADVFYKKRKFGELDLHNWLPASSKPWPTSSDHADLQVISSIKNAPLIIKDSDIFSEVVSELLMSSKGIKLTVKADVDVEMKSALGKLVIRQIPAEGEVPVHPIGSHDFSGLDMKMGSLLIADTSPHSLTLTAAVNITNPTNYTATVPYVDVKIAVNETLIGHATIANVSVVAGDNINMPVTAYWTPLEAGGEKGRAIGSELLSQYISGYNTSLTFHMHRDSMPSSPAIGEALKNFNITVPMPSLGTPRDPDEPSDPGKEPKDKPHFIRSTIFHLVTSTAVFTLASPFEHTTMYITHMNATAMYKNNSAGTIDYRETIEIPPGLTTTPRLPVDWSFDSLGFDAIKHALGGQLKLDARADCGVRIGEYEDNMWYEGRGIGAGVRL